MTERNEKRRDRLSEAITRLLRAPETGKKSAPLVPPKPTSRPGLAAYSGQSGGAGDPNRLAVLAQTSAQSSVESGPDTTTEGSVYRGAIQ